MSPIEQIKKGIQKQDWDLVKSAYCTLTGETLEVSTPTTKKKTTTKKKVTKKTTPKKKITKPKKKEQEDELLPSLSFADEMEINNLLNNVAPPSKDGPVNRKDRKVTFISSSEETEEKTLNAKRAKSVAKLSRPEYKPALVNCSQCGKKIDLNKIARIEANIYRCPKCLQVTEMSKRS